MLFIPGFIISLVSFPGVIVHEFAHERFCKLYNIPVYEVCYFQLGDPAGYVLHDDPEGYRQSFMISVAPFIINTILAFGLFVLLTLFWGRPDGSGFATDTFGVAGWVVLWLGLSIGMHSFPSRGDAKGIWHRTGKEWKANPLTLLGLPFVAVIYAANLLSFLWFDVIYAGALLFAALSSITVIA